MGHSKAYTILVVLRRSLLYPTVIRFEYVGDVCVGEDLCADTLHVFEIITIIGLFVISVNRKILLIFMHTCYSILQETMILLYY